MPTKLDLLLGRIAMNRGLISQRDLERCLDIQEKEEFSRPLGRILLDERLISNEDLEKLLKDQKEALAQKDVFDVKCDQRRRQEDLSFGEVALRKKTITNEDLERALRRQADLEEKGYFPRLGEILIDLGVISAELVEEILEYQRRGVIFCDVCSKAFFRDEIVNKNCTECGAVLRI